MPKTNLPLLLNDAVAEREFQRVVVACARLFGWRVHHTRPAIMRSGKWATPLQGDAGLPDLILCRPPRLIFAELKSEHGRTRPEQQAWLSALAQVPRIEVYVWRPSDWAHIVKILSGDAP